MKQSTSIACLLVAIAAISCSSILIRMTHTPPLVIAFYRQLFSALLLLPFARSSAPVELSRRDWVLLTLSGLFLALHFATWITGLLLTSVARATLFVDLQPIWAAILGALVLNETLAPLEIVGVCVVSAGGILSIGSHWGLGYASVKGDLLALSGGLAGACYLLIGRKVRMIISWVRYMTTILFISAGWLLLFQLVLTQSPPAVSNQDLLWILLMALVPSLLGHGLFNVAIRHLKAYVVNAAFLGEPVLATILAYLFFKEVPDFFFYAGAVLIFLGLFLLFTTRALEPEESRI